MTRARWLLVLVGAGLLGSCGDGLEPPTTGSIALIIQIAEQAQVTVPALARGSSDTSVAGDSGSAVAIAFDAVSYTSARARAVGPSTRTVDLQLVDNFWEGSIDALAPGTYTVTVEGLEAGEISALGTTSGVDVVAGQQSTASVSLASFLPNVTVGIGSPTTSLEIPITVSTVQNADGYRVEWAGNPEFTSATSRSLTEPSTVLSLSALGTFYVRARAVSGTVAGAPGTAQSFQTVGDVPGTGDAAGSALPLGFGTTINQRLTQLNIVPATDQDWFSLEGCTGDSVVIETFATRLTPASKLNTVIRVFTADGATLIAENDDLDGTTTDSRLRTMLLGDDQYALQVTSAPPGSSGHYEIDFQVIPGTKNMGTYCQIVKRVAVSPATATIAPGATEQLSATGFDETDATVPGVRFLWVSSNTNVAVVDTTGLVTGMGGGDATISASGHGEPGYAVITVTGPALGAPTQVAFSVQPTTSTAGSAFSPAIDVEIRDANGNLVSDARDAVTLAIADNPGGATLYGTKTVNANNGVARFTGLWMDKAASGYTMSATSGTLPLATSVPFAVNPGSPAMVAFGTQPTDVAGNAAFNPVVTATISDAFNNVVTGATNPVTVDFAVNIWKSLFSPGAALFGIKTVNAVAGVATFSNLRVDKPGAGYTLSASATGLSNDTSSDFAVTLAAQQVRAAKMGNHTCATAASGTFCWGYGGNGQLGDGTGTFTSDSVARLVSGNFTFTQIAAGPNHTCALTAEGAAYCWGYNGYGQLGNNSTTPSDAPVAVSGGLTFASITAGNFHTCGRVGTAVYCWGRDNVGQLGDDAPLANKLVPTVVAGGFNWTSVSAGYATTCGLTGGNAHCWGQDNYGQLGNDGVLANAATPVLVAGGQTWTDVNPGYYHTCGVNASGAGYCWGTNYDGRLGVDTLTYAMNSVQGTPVPVFGGLTWTTIQTGWFGSCGLTTASAAYCWGYNYDGQLGGGTFGNFSSVRAAVAGSLTFSALSVGGDYTCGRVGTAVWCWGYNGNGQLGDGSQLSKNQPVQMVQ
jgi:alpha-tubulin suppressor-like RCC1 family protein